MLTGGPSGVGVNVAVGVHPNGVCVTVGVAVGVPSGVGVRVMQDRRAPVFAQTVGLDRA